MQREHSDMDMNGHRPQSPSSADNAPSPSKRPRLEVQQGQPMPPNGRVPGQMPAQMTQQQAMLMQNGMNGRGMNPAQFQAFQQQQAGQAAAQQKSMQVYAQNLLLHHSRSAMNNQGMPNGLMNNGLMPNQNDLMSQMPDGQGGMQMVNGQFYNGDMAGMGRGMPQVPNGNGNHALQDYQMQLMLLEQQNKRRLMMARQEQDSITTRPDGQPMPPGQPGLPPGTSPQGSRTGASPNPSEQMKRGTPKISQTGLPGSPSAGDLQGRGSPASMNFNPGQMGADMSNAFFNNMRPPTSNQGGFNPQMNQAMQQPNGRMPNANWQNPGGPQGQPMVAQQSPATQAAPNPQERNTMPPPSAPPQGTKPPSPQQGAAPPTPQQANKPAPKKKDTGKERKVRLNIVVQCDFEGCTDLPTCSVSQRKELLLPMPILQRPRRPRPNLHQHLLHPLPSRLSIQTLSPRMESMQRRPHSSSLLQRLLHLLYSNPILMLQTLMTLACQTYV